MTIPNSSSQRIVVVGAGAAGLACGWRLALAGHDVTVVDRGEIGKGALWASGGMLAPGFEASVELDADHELATSFTRLLHDSLGCWPDWIEALQSYSLSPLGFNQDGSITPVYGEAEHGRAMAAKAQAEALGVNVQWLEPDHLAASEPGLAKADGALFFGDDGQLDNRALGPALAAAVFAAGGRIEMRSGVKALARNAGAVCGVRLENGRVLEVDQVLLATGAQRLDGVPQPVATRPVKGQMLAFDLGTSASLQHVVRGFSIYLCRKPGGRLIAGATVERDVDDLETTGDAKDALLEAARQVMPQLGDHTPVEHWSGLRPAARDLMPVVGELEPGLLVAGGGYRNGVLLAPIMAEAITALVEGRGLDPVSEAFAPHRASLHARRDH